MSVARTIIRASARKKADFVCLVVACCATVKIRVGASRSKNALKTIVVMLPEKLVNHLARRIVLNRKIASAVLMRFARMNCHLVVRQTCLSPVAIIVVRLEMIVCQIMIVCQLAGLIVKNGELNAVLARIAWKMSRGAWITKLKNAVMVESFVQQQRIVSVRAKA
jgi:hypothetical protein